MGKFNNVVLVASLCVLAFACSVHCTDVLNVVGKVYCDTCRVGFVTRITEYIEGADVKIECHNRSTNLLTASAEGRTDETGTYNIPVKGEHEDDICEVQLVKSPSADCNEPYEQRSSARVLLTKNNGIVSDFRNANPLGFLKKEALPECTVVLKELGIVA
ncbi:pollen allergen Che a 1-like [Aristolochia californica]|uniref:pollen allergen Che a 1-like n=1 Tax=Aristolochia californica TaxID=171875 RepID=UPI0035D901B1